MQAEAFSAAPIDMAALQRTTDGDNQFLAELIELYLADVPVRLQKLSQAVDTGVAAEIKNEAHSLKGASANLAAVELQQLFARLEQAGANSQLDQAGQLYTLAMEEFQRVRDYLQQILATI